jgi:hypothetical protein
VDADAARTLAKPVRSRRCSAATLDGPSGKAGEMNPEKRTSWFLRGVRSETLMEILRRTETSQPGVAWRPAAAGAGATTEKYALRGRV